jgi:hypothetical protein
MMSEGRPDPDPLLECVRADEACEARGKLKIFFEAAAIVLGKPARPRWRDPSVGRRVTDRGPSGHD